MTNVWLYALLPIPNRPPTDVSIDFVMGEIVRLHGIPRGSVSDRAVNFRSSFRQTLLRLFCSNLKLSIAFHPRLDSQTGVVYQSLGDLLRCLVVDKSGFCLPTAT